MRTAKLKIDTLKWRIGRLVPRKYGPWKAVSPESEADSATGPKRLKIEVRRWAVTPDKQLVELTEQVRGLEPEQIEALRRAVQEGRYLPPSRDAPPDFELGT